MRLSIWPGLDQPWTDVLDLARFADRGGWDTFYVEDHFVTHPPGDLDDPLLEATATLAAVAAVTERIHLGTLVLSVTYRHPTVIANWAAALDQISGGRVVLGLGAGWQEDEHARYGIRLGPPGERVDRFVEGLRIVRGMLETERTTVEGTWFTVHDAICEPKPVQAHLPILVGAKQPRMLGVVARYADRWNLWASPEVLAERGRVLDAHCERVGRDPATIERSAQAMLCVTADPARSAAFLADSGPRARLAGTPEQVAEQIHSYAAVGLDEFIVVVDAGFGRGAEREDTLSALHEAFEASRPR